MNHLCLSLKLDSNQHISAYLRHLSEPVELLSDKTGLLLEDKKPLERTPHFFEPVVDECVNAPANWWIGLESNQLPAVDLVLHSPVLPTHMNVGCFDEII